MRAETKTEPSKGRDSRKNRKMSTLPEEKAKRLCGSIANLPFLVIWQRHTGLSVPDIDSPIIM